MGVLKQFECDCSDGGLVSFVEIVLSENFELSQAYLHWNNFKYNIRAAFKDAEDTPPLLLFFSTVLISWKKEEDTHQNLSSCNEEKKDSLLGD